MTSSNGNILRVTGPLCGEFTGPGEFPTQRPVTRSFDVYFDLRLNKRLCKQSWGWWFETLLCPLWRHSNEMWFESSLIIMAGNNSPPPTKGSVIRKIFPCHDVILSRNDTYPDITPTIKWRIHTRPEMLEPPVPLPRRWLQYCFHLKLPAFHLKSDKPIMSLWHTKALSTVLTFGRESTGVRVISLIKGHWCAWLWCLYYIYIYICVYDVSLNKLVNQQLRIGDLWRHECRRAYNAQNFWCPDVRRRHRTW